MAGGFAADQIIAGIAGQVARRPKLRSVLNLEGLLLGGATPFSLVPRQLYVHKSLRWMAGGFMRITTECLAGRVCFALAIVWLLVSCGGGGTSTPSGGGGGGSPPPGGGSGGSSATYTISGSIQSGGGSAVRVAGPTNTVVDVATDGTYRASGLTAGTYVVTPEVDGATFAPASRTVVVTNADVTVETFALQVDPDVVAPQVLAEIEQGTPTPVDYQTLTFPDGTRVADYLPGAANGRAQVQAAGDSVVAKKQAIAKMLQLGTDYECGRPGAACRAGVDWTRAEDKSLLPLLAPKQEWLAYSYGGKQVASRSTPVGACGNYRIFGVDCSGFVGQMASAAGISAPAGTEGQQDESKWDLSSIGLKMGIAAVGNYEQGDLIVWRSDKAQHIAIALGNGPNPAALSSLGRKGPAAECVGNVSNAKRGPVTYPLSWLTATKALGPVTKVLRIQAPLSGTVSLSGPAAITGSTCTGSMSVTANGEISLFPSPVLTWKGTEAINLSCYTSTMASNVSIPLTSSGTKLTGNSTFPFTCSPPCISGSATFTADLTLNSAAAGQTVTGTVTYVNENRTPFRADLTGTISFTGSPSATLIGGETQR